MATEVSREPSSARSSAAHALPMSNIDWRRRDRSSRVVLCRGPRLPWERPESNTTRWAICGSSGKTSELIRLALANVAPWSNEVPAFPQQRDQRVERQGLAEKIALHLVAPQQAEVFR